MKDLQIYLATMQLTQALKILKPKLIVLIAPSKAVKIVVVVVVVEEAVAATTATVVVIAVFTVLLIPVTAKQIAWTPALVMVI